MKYVDYGYVRINLQQIMDEQNISINKLAFRAEMQRTQLKSYIKNDVQRLDISSLCHCIHRSAIIPKKNATHMSGIAQSNLLC